MKKKIVAKKGYLSRYSSFREKKEIRLLDYLAEVISNHLD